MLSILDLSQSPATRDADLTDAVMADAETLAQQQSAKAWQAFAKAGKPRFLTCRKTDFQDEAALFAKLAAWRPSGLHLPDVQSPPDLDLASTLLRVMEVRLDLPQFSMPLIASLATTAAASLNLNAFARPHPRLTACLFNPRALAGDLQIADLNADAIRQVRATLLLVARAAGCPVLQRTEAEGGAAVYTPM